MYAYIDFNLSLPQRFFKIQTSLFPANRNTKGVYRLFSIISHTCSLAIDILYRNCTFCELFRFYKKKSYVI